MLEQGSLIVFSHSKIEIYYLSRNIEYPVSWFRGSLCCWAKNTNLRSGPSQFWSTSNSLFLNFACISASVPCECNALGGQKRALDSLQLDLCIVVSCCVSAKSSEEQQGLLVKVLPYRLNSCFARENFLWIPKTCLWESISSHGHTFWGYWPFHSLT